MAEYRRVVLPVATPEYNSNNEQVSRATVTQTLEEMQSDIAANTKKTSKERFLLMGAS